MRRLFHDNTTCDPTRCTKFPTGMQAIVCVDKGSQPPCNAFNDNSHCPTGSCKWNDGAQRCHDPNVGLDCEFYLDTDLCPADKCRVVAGLCVDKEKPIDCSSFYFGDTDVCNKHIGCRPDCDEHKCVPCPASGTCDDTPCPDVTPAPQLNCTTHRSEEECRSDPSCKWDGDVRACVEGDVGTPCSDLLEPSQCNDARDCAWDFGRCVECPNGNCKLITTTATPDTGKACSTYDEDSCPYPRCSFAYDGGASGACRASACHDLRTEDDCKGDKHCTFDQTIFVCYKTADGPPCRYYGEEAQCNALQQCVWDSDDFYCSGEEEEVVVVARVCLHACVVCGLRVFCACLCLCLRHDVCVHVRACVCVFGFKFSTASSLSLLRKKKSQAKTPARSARRTRSTRVHSAA